MHKNKKRQSDKNRHIKWFWSVLKHPLCTKRTCSEKRERKIFFFKNILIVLSVNVSKEKDSDEKKSNNKKKAKRRAEKPNLSIAIDPTQCTKNQNRAHTLLFVWSCDTLSAIQHWFCYTLLRHYLFNSSYIMVRSIYNNGPFFCCSVRNTWIDVSISNAKYSELKKESTNARKQNKKEIQ